MTRTVSVAALAEAIRPGERLYLPGCAGEPAAFMAALEARPDRARDCRILSTAVPGINRLALDKLDPSVRVSGLFMQPDLRDAQREGRFRHLPVAYSGFVRHLRERAEIDTCVVQVAPPDASGRCSLGAAVEFTPLALSRSRRRFAVLNPAMPRIPGAPSLPVADFDLVAEAETPLPSYDTGRPSASADAIARHIARFVEDGAALQAGLGKVPEALFAMLHDRRGLRLQSGMLSGGALRLSEAGALDPAFPHMSCVWVGPSDLYGQLDGLPGFEVAGCEVTHDIRRLSRADGFVAVNSALAVDLFGQANLEHAEGRSVSGVGGAGDFAAAARLSRGGLSIVALPASYGREPRSRIVPALGDGIVSLPRSMIDIVITEHGVADLRDLCVHGRAEALIAVAAPEFRSGLAAAWDEIKNRL